jgi:acetyltransferase-like isoleucine patch superfamily enzyme
MKSGLINSFLRWCPGAIGILLRKKLYPFFLGACGRGVLFGRFIDFQNAKNIHIGDNVIVSNHCRLLAGVDKCQSITIENDVFIGIGTILHAESEAVFVNWGTNIGSGCRIIARKSVLIGSDVLIAAYCVIGKELSCPEGQKGDAYTMIGDNVWLGTRSQILTSIHVNDGAIIGAHSIVNTHINACGIAIGRPACIVRYRK